MEKEGVSDVLDVIDAKVPILKLKLENFHIDLLYACMDSNMLSSTSSIEKLIKDDQIFNKLNSLS